MPRCHRIDSNRNKAWASQEETRCVRRVWTISASSCPDSIDLNLTSGHSPFMSMHEALSRVHKECILTQSAQRSTAFPRVHKGGCDGCDAGATIICNECLRVGGCLGWA
ncbi:hypothetical protein CDAR_394551 [Caerostris darwini]|uniref:Uncharacterized protein n=1 Tax=Caerostris darwini TaxID=1538125 RepID=A0AAV4P9R0_9ARAC|nr:hypothetical protein CDAR_394551 [Caerostris darwini]